EQLRARHDAGFGFRSCLHDDHHAHDLSPCLRDATAVSLPGYDDAAPSFSTIFMAPVQSPQMQYLLLVYVDPALMDQLPPEGFNQEMKQCMQHADDLARDGTLVAFQQLEPPSKARAVRVRGGRTSIL